MPRYRPRPRRATYVPSRLGRHYLTRLGTGLGAQAYADLRAAGSPAAWLERQLQPESVPESPRVAEVESWFADQAWSAAAKRDSNDSRRKAAWEFARDFGNLQLLRRTYTRRVVAETMTDFWANHLHVGAAADLAWMHRYDYQSVLRTHALGRFEDLLVAASTHPAMTLFLDNWRSARGAVNENQGRELLELHTVGLVAGYSEQMVKDSAVILSGWDVAHDGGWEGRYTPSKHTTVPVSVLGFTHPNADADGRAVCDAYLRHLARHPATARTIATKLVLRFVDDDPHPELVRDLAATYLAEDTRIAPVLRRLVASAEFRRSVGAKVRTPHEDLVATLRVLEPRLSAPGGEESFAITMAWTHGSVAAYQWPRPDGPPERNDPWCSPTRMVNSFGFHWAMTAGWWPREGVAYRTPEEFLPGLPLRFDQLVDHLCRTLLGRRSTRRLLAMACQATDTPPREMITPGHQVLSQGWIWVKLVGALLDSPEHMTR
ncbi:DUF1800 domain-containing protein [Nocardioidaceae bacterium]|nr:DUF1800 domain-containing protein [Nocardioidaceae bacterium]